MTLLTVKEAAEFLKMSASQIYSMTKARGRERMEKPIPTLRLNGNLRFSKESLEQWLSEVEEK